MMKLGLLVCPLRKKLKKKAASMKEETGFNKKSDM
jgi:hypothetical protein